MLCLWLQSPFWKWDNASSGWERESFVPPDIFCVTITGSAEKVWAGRGSYLQSLLLQIMVQTTANCQSHTASISPSKWQNRSRGRNSSGSVTYKSSFHLQMGLYNPLQTPSVAYWVRSWLYGWLLLPSLLESELQEEELNLADRCCREKITGPQMWNENSELNNVPSTWKNTKDCLVFELRSHPDFYMTGRW